MVVQSLLGMAVGVLVPYRFTMVAFAIPPETNRKVVGNRSIPGTNWNVLLLSSVLYRGHSGRQICSLLTKKRPSSSYTAVPSTQAPTCFSLAYPT